MKILLDTHVFVWMDSEPAKLSSTAESLILDPQNSLLISVASLWEVQIKAMLAKLSLSMPLAQLVVEQQRRNRLSVLAVTAEHIYELSQLPPIHHDPFDRLLAGVARSENATLLTADPIFRQYPVALKW